MKTMILFLATLISLAGCREKEDDRTPDFTLVGDWEVESFQNDKNDRGKEDDWLNTSIEIRAIDNEQFIFNVQGAPSDTIWPVTSVWKKIVESETEIVLENPLIPSTSGGTIPDKIITIFKHSPDRIRVFKFVDEDFPPFHPILLPCCGWGFNMKRKTEQLK